MKRKNAIILGGGPLACSLVYNLLKKNYKITVIESNKKIGGLAIPFFFDEDLIECYYHFFYHNDSKSALDFLKKNKIKYNMQWSEISTDIFQNGKFISFDSLNSIFKIAGFEFWKPITALFLLKIFRPSKKLDLISAKSWSRKKFGNAFCEYVWYPLLKNKFGNDWEKISALWLATRIRRHLSTKVLSSGKSRFGYLTNTYEPLLKKINKEIYENDGRIFTNETVKEFKIIDNKIKKIITSKQIINVEDNSIVFSTIPLLNLNNIKPLNEKLQYLNFFNGIGAVVIVLKIKNKLSNAYWTTVTDKRIEFDAMIQHNRIYNNYSNEIVYLSRYYDVKNKIFTYDNDDILNIFLNGIKIMFSKFSDDQLINYKIFKVKMAAPIPYINTYSYLPKFKSNIENFYHAGYEHIYPEDRGVGNSIDIGKKMYDEFLVNNS